MGLPQVTVVAVKFATTGSVNVAPLAAGPLLLTASVKLTAPLPFTVAVPVFTTARSVTVGVIVVFAVLLLLAGLTSVMPAGAVTVAVLAIVPLTPAVPLNVNVRLPPLGNVAMTMPAPCSAASVETGQAAPPLGLPQVTVVAVKFATTGSVNVAPLAAAGPLLLITIVYVTAPLLLTVVVPVFTTARSVTVGVIVVFAMLLLLAGLPSVTPAGADTVAVLAIVPVTAAVPVNVNVTLPPLGSVDTTMPLPWRAASVVIAGHAAPPPAPAQMTPVAVKFATTGSVTVAPSAAEGPLLVTTIV